MSLTALLRPTFTQMLEALAAWLDKAAAHQRAAGHSADDLMVLRLAPDMHPLAAQVRFACLQAQEPIWRLCGQPLPEILQALQAEGWAAGERPGNIEDAQGRIREALAALAALDAGALDEGAGERVLLALPNGMTFEMTGDRYARDWALPQFYFHLNTAYAILRAHGVALGKADYVPHMLAYLKPAIGSAA